MSMTSHRITKISAAKGVLMRQGECPAIHHLWHLLYKYMGQTIQSLNQHLSGRIPARQTLDLMARILNTEVNLLLLSK